MNIDIWGADVPGFKPEHGQVRPTLTPYLLAGSNSSSAMVVLPGGGYAKKADHEGSAVAKWLNTIGIQAFVLDYRVAPYRHPYPMCDATRAIQYVRTHARQYNINPDQIGIMGFSAGGHLAMTATVYPVSASPKDEDPVARVSSRPDCLVLGYPVISMGEYTHQGSRSNLLGAEAAPELVAQLSLENQVHADVPPTFVWHTTDDQSVPVENSLMLALGLSKYQVEFALHIFKHGRHGLGLANEQPEVREWTTLCAEWLSGIGFR